MRRLSRMAGAYNEVVADPEQMERILKQAQDNLTVIVAAQDRHGRMLVDRQEWLERHTQDIARHREFVQEHAATMQAIDRKLDRLTELILKGHAGNGGGNGS